MTFPFEWTTMQLSGRMNDLVHPCIYITSLKGSQAGLLYHSMLDTKAVNVSYPFQLANSICKLTPLVNWSAKIYDETSDF